MMIFLVKILFSRPFSHSQPTGLEYLQLHLLLPLPTHWSLLMTPLFKSRSKWRNPKLEEIGCHQIIHEDLDNCETKFPLKRLIIKPLSPCRVLVSTVEPWVARWTQRMRCACFKLFSSLFWMIHLNPTKGQPHPTPSSATKFPNYVCLCQASIVKLRRQEFLSSRWTLLHFHCPPSQTMNAPKCWPLPKRKSK